MFVGILFVLTRPLKTNITHIHFSDCTLVDITLGLIRTNHTQCDVNRGTIKIYFII
jgi:hypothetical protein